MQKGVEGGVIRGGMHVGGMDNWAHTLGTRPGRMTDTGMLYRIVALRIGEDHVSRNGLFTRKEANMNVLLDTSRAHIV